MPVSRIFTEWSYVLSFRTAELALVPNRSLIARRFEFKLSWGGRISAEQQMLPIKKNRRFVAFPINFYGRYYWIIGWRTSGNYYDKFASNKFSILLLLERPKPPTSIISGFLDPWEPLFVDSNIQTYYEQSKKDLLFKVLFL